MIENLDTNGSLNADWLDKLYKSVFNKDLLHIPINNKRGGKVDLCIIGSGGQSGFHPISPINTNNSIAVWYALKTTIDYLKNRSQIEISDEERKRLDKAAAINLKNISEYLGDDFDSKFKKDSNKNFDDEINTNKNNDLNINNENIQQNRPVATMSELEEILKSQAGQAGVDNELKKYNDYLESIDDVVFDKLIKKKASVENEGDINNLISNKDDRILLVKKDFDGLKQELKDQKKSESNLDISNIPDDRKKDYETRDEKVFLSKAAKEFKDKVSELDNVKKSNERDQKVEDYNKAVEELDNAIKEAVKTKIEGYYNSFINGYDKSELGSILTALGLDNTNKNGINGNNIQENNVVVNNNKLHKKIDAFIKTLKGNYITGNYEDQLLTMLSGGVKSKWVNYKSDKDRQEYINTFLPENKRESVLGKLNEFNTKFQSLSEKDKTKVLFNGNKIEEKENKGDNENVSDLKAIANDKELEKITPKYDEYNEFVATGLFQNIDDININGCMEDFLNNLLLADHNGDEFKKAKGQLDGIALQLNKELDSDNANNNNTNKSLEHILSIGFSQCALGNKKDSTKEEFFVPTFLNHLFSLMPQTSQLKNLCENIGQLGEDKNFQSLLSMIMKSDFAVGVIQKNFERVRKSFGRENSGISRWGMFFKEFWDNNLKAIIPRVGKWDDMKKIMKNIAMLSGSFYGGWTGGNIIAGVFGLSLSGGVLPAILTLLIIFATIIAIAALISLVITVVKGIKNWKDNSGFYRADKDKVDEASKAKEILLLKIYSAFLTLGADTKTLGELVQKADKDRTPTEKKFLSSMIEMKDFLEKNKSSYPQQTNIFDKNSPFDKIKNALKGPNVPDIEVNNNVGNNLIQ